MTRQRQNSIHTGFELPVKFPRTSVFSSPQPAAWACQALLAVTAKAWERWGCPGADGDALVLLGKGESPSALLSADGEVEARRIQGSFLTSEASQVWKVLSSINAQVEECVETPGCSFVPREPFATQRLRSLSVWRANGYPQPLCLLYRLHGQLEL